MVPEEMSHELLESVLAGAALVYMDGRLTEAALVLSRAARAKGIPVRRPARVSVCGRARLHLCTRTRICACARARVPAVLAIWWCVYCVCVGGGAGGGRRRGRW